MEGRGWEREKHHRNKKLRVSSSENRVKSGWSSGTLWKEQETSQLPIPTWQQVIASPRPPWTLLGLFSKDTKAERSWALEHEALRRWSEAPYCKQADLPNLPWRGKRHPTPGSLPGEFHQQRSLAGYSPWGRKESDTKERLILPTSLPVS